MSTKHKASKPKRFAMKDAEDRRKFLITLAVATVLLMVLMYYIFTR